MKPARRLKNSRFALLALLAVVPATVCAETVPDLVGLHLSEIEFMTEAADLSFEVQKVDSTERRGEVLLQIPGAGSGLGTGRRIYIKVSNGVTVPDVRGRMRSEAEAELEAAGIGSAVTQRPYTGVRDNLVAKQIPDGGTRIDASQWIIFLVVSEGTRIPNLIGTTHYAALDSLETLGLKGHIVPAEFVSSIGDICSGTTYFSSRVTETRPRSGTLVEPGAQVAIHYERFVHSRRSGAPCSVDGIPH